MKEEPIATVVWEKPPNSQQPRYDWPAIAALLRSRPNEWARIFERDRVSLVNAIRQGNISALRPDLGFEAQTTNNERGPGARTATLYMRWNPAKAKE